MKLVVFSIAVYFYITFFGYITHWALHQKWMGRFHRSHLCHHTQLYPPNDYTSSKYRSAGKDSALWFYILIGMPMVASPFLLYYFNLAALWICVILCLEIIFLGLCNNYIHDSFHIKRGFFTGGIFKPWNRHHYFHHLDMTKNFGIFSFWCDKLFLTFKNKLK